MLAAAQSRTVMVIDCKAYKAAVTVMQQKLEAAKREDAAEAARLAKQARAAAAAPTAHKKR
jgi:hypothetical protein